MSKARGLITGGNFESRSSGMYDSVDNVRIAAISQAGLKKVGMEQKNLYTTGLSVPYSFAWSPDGLHLYLAYSGDYIKHIQCTSPFNTSGSIEVPLKFTSVQLFPLPNLSSPIEEFPSIGR